jgi:TonB family protein
MHLVTRPLALWCVAAFAPFANAQLETHLGSNIPSQGSSAYLNSGSRSTAAVDAKGIVHYGTEYVGVPPWFNDRVKTVAPEYPHSERVYRHQGRGLIRLILDLRTGSVTNAVVVKSTGFGRLDQSATSAFKHWTWKPGKWKERYLPVTFQIGNTTI